MVEFMKRSPRILKKTIPSPRKSKNIFLIVKHSKSKIFEAEYLVSFLSLFRGRHPGLLLLISKWHHVRSVCSTFFTFLPFFRFVMFCHFDSITGSIVSVVKRKSNTWQ